MVVAGEIVGNSTGGEPVDIALSPVVGGEGAGRKWPSCVDGESRRIEIGFEVVPSSFDNDSFPALKSL